MLAGQRLEGGERLAVGVGGGEVGDLGGKCEGLGEGGGGGGAEEPEQEEEGEAEFHGEGSWRRTKPASGAANL